MEPVPASPSPSLLPKVTNWVVPYSTSMCDFRAAGGPELSTVLSQLCRQQLCDNEQKIRSPGSKAVRSVWCPWRLLPGWISARCPRGTLPVQVIRFSALRRGHCRGWCHRLTALRRGRCLRLARQLPIGSVPRVVTAGAGVTGSRLSGEACAYGWPASCRQARCPERPLPVRWFKGDLLRCIRRYGLLHSSPRLSR